MKWRRKKKKRDGEFPGGVDPFANQPGPCKMCGATNYVLSYGGPDVCPSCDAGVPTRPDTLDLSAVSSSSIVWVTNTSSPNQLTWGGFAGYAATFVPPQDSDEYQEFLRWKKRREEEAKEEPPKLERPMRLIEL